MSCEKCKQRREAARKALIDSAVGLKSVAVKMVEAIAKPSTKKRGSTDE